MEWRYLATKGYERGLIAFCIYRLSSSLGHNSVDTLVGLNWADGTINVYGPEVGRRSLATELKDFCEEREHLNILSSFPLTSMLPDCLKSLLYTIKQVTEMDILMLIIFCFR